MGCGVRPPQGLGIKAMVYEFLVLKIGESLFLQGDVNTYSTILPTAQLKENLCKCNVSYIWIFVTHVYRFHRNGGKNMTNSDI